MMTRNMAAAAPKKPAPATEGASRDSSPRPKLASEEAVPVASHVHGLQAFLARRLDAPTPAKWPARATIGFVVLVCGAFWAAAFLVIRLLIH